MSDIKYSDLTKEQRTELIAKQSAYMADKFCLCMIAALTHLESDNFEEAKSWLDGGLMGYDQDYPDSPEKVQDWYNSKMDGRDFPIPSDMDQ